MLLLPLLLRWLLPRRSKTCSHILSTFLFVNLDALVFLFFFSWLSLPPFYFRHYITFSVCFRSVVYFWALFHSFFQIPFLLSLVLLLYVMSKNSFWFFFFCFCHIQKCQRSDFRLNFLPLFIAWLFFNTNASESICWMLCNKAWKTNFKLK